MLTRVRSRLLLNILLNTLRTLEDLFSNSIFFIHAEDRSIRAVCLSELDSERRVCSSIENENQVAAAWQRGEEHGRGMSHIEMRKDTESDVGRCGRKKMWIRESLIKDIWIKDEDV